MEETLLQHPHTEWLARLEKSELPYGEVRNIGQVVAHPQVAARGMIREVDSPVGCIPVTSSPLRPSESPARFGHIPALGEDTEAILRELGYSEAEIKTMHDQQVI